MSQKTHESLVKSALTRPEVRDAYDEISEEFTLFEEMIKARLKSNQTQAEVAKAMGTTTSVVGRLETGGGKYAHSPTIATLQKYAKALGCVLSIKLRPKRS